MSYALIVNGAVAAYPYTFAQLRAANPQVSFPADPSDEKLEEFGVYRVAAAARPAPDPTKNIVEGQPALVNGAWTRTWTLVDAPQDEIAERQLQAAHAADQETVKGVPLVSQFLAMTPAQVENYINTNGTTVTGLRAIVILLAKMLLVLARRQLR